MWLAISVDLNSSTYGRTYIVITWMKLRVIDGSGFRKDAYFEEVAMQSQPIYEPVVIIDPSS